jgi:phosphoglycolate phosphatase-like HAD superfamily hydrolase
MERPIAILFDIDGTLISTGGAGTRSWRGAFQKLYGIPADIGRYTEAGMTDPTVGRATFLSVIGHDPTEQEMARLMAAYLACLPDEVERSEGYRVLEGVEKLLPQLCEEGFLLGITTGALEAAAHIKLSRAALNRFFSFGGYGSDSDDRAELTRSAIERGGAIIGHTLNASRVLVVGDTPLDIEAAHAAGAVGVGVASGHHSVDQLRGSGADYVISSLAEPLPGVQEPGIS